MIKSRAFEIFLRLQHDGRPTRRDPRPALDPTRPRASLTTQVRDHPARHAHRRAPLPAPFTQQNRTSKPGLNAYLKQLCSALIGQVEDSVQDAHAVN